MPIVETAVSLVTRHYFFILSKIALYMYIGTIHKVRNLKFRLTGIGRHSIG